VPRGDDAEDPAKRSARLFRVCLDAKRLSDTPVREFVDMMMI